MEGSGQKNRKGGAERERIKKIEALASDAATYCKIRHVYEEGTSSVKGHSACAAVQDCGQTCLHSESHGQTSPHSFHLR